MIELQPKQVIEIRKRLLDEFDKMCTEKGLKYSLAYGTLLGAIRHKGMIPWDDDIDVVMTREEYEKLVAIYRAPDCKDRFQFVSHRNHPEIKTKIGYFIDFDTITETAHKTNEYHGVHIDVYPLDIMPNSSLKLKIMLMRWWFLQKIIRAKDVHPEVMHGAGKLLRKMVLLAVAPFSYDRTLEKLHKVARKYENMPESERRSTCVFCESEEPVFYPYAATKEYALYEYDGKQYPGFKDYDCFLKTWYGDYMTPPPQSAQHPVDRAFVHFYMKDKTKG
ncbi:MAG: LicD family protein [Clostridiales bacterium]|nr:LicD family protein [Clostridiales bacterium]